MRQHVIRHKETGEPPDGRQNRVYSTEAGAKQGLTAVVDRATQHVFLYDETRNYNDYLNNTDECQEIRKRIAGEWEIRPVRVLDV